MKTIHKICQELGVAYKPLRKFPKRIQKLGTKHSGNKIYFNEEEEKIIIDYLKLPPLEKAKIISLEKYGVDNPSKSEEIKEKIKNIVLEKYGTVCSLLNNEVKQKRKETMIEKYGAEYSSQSKIIKEKYKKTMLEKYGVEHPSYSKEIREKCKKTILERYGVENLFYSEEIKEKCKKTMLERYGVEYSGQSSILLQKTIENNIKNNGYFKTSNVYNYDNINFNSSWEIYYYFYLKYNNIPFVYSPIDKKFFYYYDNKKHRYFPDFKVYDRYVEIKGDHFFDKDGNFISPYKKEDNYKYKAKWNCMMENNILILKREDIVPFKKFFISKGEKI